MAGYKYKRSEIGAIHNHREATKKKHTVHALLCVKRCVNSVNQ